MICVELTRKKNGELTACKASGHADFADTGPDIVCAAVSVLMRTAMTTLSQSHGIQFRVAPLVRGQIAFSVCKDDEQKNERLVFALDFLQAGFESLAAEYPEHVAVRIITEK